MAARKTGMFFYAGCNFSVKGKSNSQQIFKMKKKILFRGTGTALVTPFTIENTLEESALQKLVEFQIKNGVDALIPTGTTGESPTLTKEEHARVIEIVAKQNRGRKKIIAGTGSNSTAQTISLSLHVKEFGVDGFLLVGPYYNKPTQEGFYRHFAEIASKVSLPIILYNIPGRTGSNFTAETTLRLAEEIPNIVGIKEASGNIEQVMEILRNRPKNFAVYAGDDAMALPFIALGGDGVISVIANEAPKLFTQMIRLCLAGNFLHALRLHNQLLPLMNFNFVESNPIPVKAA
ncbi:MAG: 4-hydroxy-tetrahydrodipicolinate synthase, partial [Bacteroidota bacterium]